MTGSSCRMIRKSSCFHLPSLIHHCWSLVFCHQPVCSKIALWLCHVFLWCEFHLLAVKKTNVFFLEKPNSAPSPCVSGSFRMVGLKRITADISIFSVPNREQLAFIFCSLSSITITPPCPFIAHTHPSSLPPHCTQPFPHKRHI